jgi:hypothetical protein
MMPTHLTGSPDLRKLTDLELNSLIGSAIRERTRRQFERERKEGQRRKCLAEGLDLPESPRSNPCPE